MIQSDDPLTCVHGNEVPSVCPCRPGCYCKGRSCSLAPVPEWRVIQSGMARFPGPELIVLDVENMGGFQVTEMWCQTHEHSLKGCAVLLALPVDYEESYLSDKDKYWLKELRAWPWVKGEFRKGRTMATPASWVTAFQEAWLNHKEQKASGTTRGARRTRAKR